MKERNFSYCQSQIEEREWCEEQCDHCRAYYKPLEEQIPTMSFIDTMGGYRNMVTAQLGFNEFTRGYIDDLIQQTGLSLSVDGEEYVQAVWRITLEVTSTFARTTYMQGFMDGRKSIK